MTAVRANESARPAQPLKVVQAVVVSAVPGKELAGRSRVVRARDRCRHATRLVRLSGYPSDAYAAAIDGEPDASLDLVIIDGRARIECARRAMPKVRPGGLLLFDDTDSARLRPVIALLGSWERHVFTGLKPGQRGPAQTSAWRRPDG